jgi:flagellar protein FlbD
MEETPDTVISLQSGKKIVVMESAEEVISRIIEFRRRVPDLRHLSEEI